MVYNTVYDFPNILFMLLLGDYMKISNQLKIQAKPTVSRLLGKINYKDAFFTELEGNDIELAKVAACFFAYMPAPVRFLMKLRDVLVKIIGLKSAEANTSADFLKNAKLVQGEKFGLWKVAELVKRGKTNYVIFYAKDKHLDFCVAIQMECNDNLTKIVVSTFVHFNRLLGKVYFAVIKPFHRMIVPSVMKNSFKMLHY